MLTISRRHLGTGLLALGATAVATSLSGPVLALPNSTPNMVVGWGSSSMAGGLSQESGSYDFLSGVGQQLGRTVKNFGIGATNMQQNLAIRGTRPVSLTFPGGVIPADSTEIMVEPEDRWVVFNGMSFPGYIEGIAGAITMRDGSVFFSRKYAGRVKKLHNGKGDVLSSLGSTYKGSYHLYWMGKNNLGDESNHQFVLDGTLETWALPNVQPDRRLQLGQWKTYRDNDVAARGVAFVNDGLREALDPKDFVDTTAVLTTEAWLTDPVVADMKLLDSAEHRDQIARGLPPRALVGSDGMHLNARGNALVATATARQATGKGWKVV